MEPSPEPNLPSPLPRPLSDPLRFYRWILLFLVPFLWVAVVIPGWLLPDVGKVREAVSGVRVDKPVRTLRDTADSAGLAFSMTILLCTLCLLPRRATNAIYLRSFRNDAATGDLRTVAQAALGSAFRLSGIRDPRRRWPGLIRHLFYILFLIRYAQPKYMNLEAGRDWKARLWRSLGAARCALIDVSELTPFVREEVELAIRCLGFHRVLFIGHDSRTADEWRQAILAALGMPDVPRERIRVALWTDTSAGRAAFRDQVRSFAKRLPADPPGLNPAAFPESAPASDPGGNAVTGEGWRMFLLANLIGVAFIGAMIWTDILTPSAYLVWYLLGAIFDALTLLLLLQYVAVCGSLWERLRLGGTFLFGAAIAGLPVVHDFVAPSNGAGARGGMICTNNLKQIGLAMDLYEQDHQQPPLPAEYTLVDSQLGGPPQQGSSWYIALLPYIEQEPLYFTSTERETWNSRRNQGLQSAMIRTYLTPTDISMAPTNPYYQLSVPGNTPHAAFDDPTGRPWSVKTTMVTDGASNTIMLGEAATAAPWDNPHYMPFDPALPPTLLGNPWSWDSQVGMADGSVHFLPKTTHTAAWSALIPRDGGEVVTPP